MAVADVLAPIYASDICNHHEDVVQSLYFGDLKRKRPFLNTLRPRQNGRHFADDTFNGIFLNKNIWFSINVSLTFLPKGRINNIPALVQIMAWRRPGDKPLSEPMMVFVPMHICVTRPQWVNEFPCLCNYILHHVLSDEIASSASAATLKNTAEPRYKTSTWSRHVMETLPALLALYLGNLLLTVNAQCCFCCC